MNTLMKRMERIEKARQTRQTVTNRRVMIYADRGDSEAMAAHQRAVADKEREGGEVVNIIITSPKTTAAHTD